VALDLDADIGSGFHPPFKRICASNGPAIAQDRFHPLVNQSGSIRRSLAFRYQVGVDSVIRQIPAPCLRPELCDDAPFQKAFQPRGDCSAGIRSEAMAAASLRGRYDGGWATIIGRYAEYADTAA
jgi:hypothetical protein